MKTTIRSRLRLPGALFWITLAWLAAFAALPVSPRPAGGAASAEHTTSLPWVRNGAAGPVLAGCPVLPADHIWNTPVDHLPVDPRSAVYIASIGVGRGFHADFGSGLWDGGPIGIPYVVVPGSQPRVPVSFDYNDESDPGPYPIPPNPPIEGGPDADGDRHILILDRGRLLAEDTPDGLARRLADVAHLTVRVEGPADEVAATSRSPPISRASRSRESCEAQKRKRAGEQLAEVGPILTRS